MLSGIPPQLGTLAVSISMIAPASISSCSVPDSVAMMSKRSPPSFTRISVRKMPGSSLITVSSILKPVSLSKLLQSPGMMVGPVMSSRMVPSSCAFARRVRPVRIAGAPTIAAPAPAHLMKFRRDNG